MGKPHETAIRPINLWWENPWFQSIYDGNISMGFFGQVFPQQVPVKSEMKGLVSDAWILTSGGEIVSSSHFQTMTPVDPPIFSILIYSSIGWEIYQNII